MTKVKICGIKTLEAAQTAIDAGADFLGFNFVQSSKRYISPEDAKVIINTIRQTDIPDNVTSPSVIPVSSRIRDLGIIGVFQNSSAEEVNKISEKLRLDGVQLHGAETPQYCQQINSKIIIKSFNLPSDFNVEEIEQKMNQYHVSYFLVDREIQGEGRHLNMQKVKTLAKSYPLFVGGGLNPSIVAQIIKTTHPFAVDVAGGVETNGKKDPEKMKQFIQNAKGVYHGKTGLFR